MFVRIGGLEVFVLVVCILDVGFFKDGVDVVGIFLVEVFVWNIVIEGL